jgi:hypothetical protein
MTLELRHQRIELGLQLRQRFEHAARGLGLRRREARAERLAGEPVGEQPPRVDRSRSELLEMLAQFRQASRSELHGGSLRGA